MSRARSSAMKCRTPASRQAVSRRPVTCSKNAVDTRALLVVTLVTSTTVSAPASAEATPAPVLRSTPSDRAMGTTCKARRRSAVTSGAPTVPVWMGEISCRALGARVESYSPTGEPLIDEVGELVITAPMPSMPVFFWGDEDGSRLRDSYFDDYPGVWRHGDWIRITSRGSCVIEGRSDATLNRGGVRMGTAEFYRVVESLHEVADSLVVDTSTAAGEGDLLLFVVLAPDADPVAVTGSVKKLIRQELSPRHVPGAVVAVPAVPRTLNGKKCEVPVKRILGGMAVDAAVSRDALADPAGFDEFIRVAQESANRSAAGRGSTG